MQTATGDLGPGAYATSNEFGTNVKGLGFGKPKPEKKIVDNRDYGYDPDKEFRNTRHRSPSALINKKGKRPDNFTLKSQVDGPEAG